ncbi:MAG: CBS domain-containing protein [Archangiaceae bacterium]|nr:CBS domain-containing protein [Archangiaceae bacterium]
MHCKDVMSRKVRCCKVSSSAAECAQIMRDDQLGFVPVVDDKGVVVGVVTDRDLALRVVAERLPPETPVVALMTAGPLCTCGPEESVRVLEARMEQTRRSRALVVDGAGALLGVISLADLAQVEPSHERTAQLLRAVASRESGAADPR